jgi:excisionase family DNA binding protein
MTNENVVYTVAETARILRIGRTLAYDYAKSGKLPAIRIGRRLLIPRAAVDKLLTEGTSLPH